MRGLDGESSLLFSVPITVEEDEPGLYSGAVETMRDRMAASGRSPEEAAANAGLLFQATVDDALARNTSVEFATGVQALTVKVAITEASKFFEMLESTIAEMDRQEHRRWRHLAPGTFAEQHPG